jgi:PAS domain S-box-containing protein
MFATMSRSLSSIRAYSLAIVSVAVALFVTLALSRPGIRGTPFIPAIMVSSWYGGVGPGLLAVGLSLLALNYFIVPRQGFAAATVDDAWYLVIFLVAALFVAWLTATQRRTGAQLQKVFEASPDGVCIVGRDYRFQRVNAVAARIWGMPIEQAIGLPMAEIVDLRGFEQRVKPALDRSFAGEEVSYAAWVETKGLGRRYLAVTYSPLRPTSDRVEAVLAIARDLTEHMEAWEALREAQAELARVTRVTMLGEITASIAHEVSQPLAAAVTNGHACRRWLAADPPHIAEAREAADGVVKSGERAGQVVARIRALVRRGTTERNVLDVNEVIREALGFTRAELERGSVAIRTKLSDGLPAVLGDRVQLQQVLVNLILNARDAMTEVNGTSAELTVGSRHEASGVLVEVKDCGRGVDAAQAQRIFEAFFSTKPTGLGMGLSVSRSIVAMHGGKIWMTPNDGPGVTMRFTLPAAPRAG